MKKGFVVKIDGIDGCGKGTLVENLRAHYAQRLNVITTREFGNDQDARITTAGKEGTVSRILCEITVNPRLNFDLIERQFMLSMVSRRQNRLVLPELRKEHDLILSDRSSLSTAYGYELGSAYRAALQWILDPVVEEDLILWIDIDPMVAFQRANRNTTFVFEDYGNDAVELRGLEHLRGVQEAYKQLAKERKNVIRLNGNVNQEALTEAAAKEIDTMLGI